jgi:hypothetical protein
MKIDPCVFRGRGESISIRGVTGNQRLAKFKLARFAARKIVRVYMHRPQLELKNRTKFVHAWDVVTVSFRDIIIQGILTGGEGSVQLTSLY